MSIALAHNEDHEAEVRALLVEQFKGESTFTDLRAWLDCYSASIQDLEDVLYDLFTLRDIDTAEGAQLDILGAIVGELRNGRVDATYRLRIKTRVKINVSSGLGDEILDIFGDVLGSDALSIAEQPGANFVLTIDQDLSAWTIAELAYILASIKGAAINGQAIYSTAAESAMFFFSDTGAVEVDVARGFTDLTLVAGGELAGVFGG